MKNVQKNHKIVVYINVMIYAKQKTELWQYRDMFHQIGKSDSYDIHLTLTQNLDTVFRIAEFLHGGVDIFVSASHIEPLILKHLIRNMWKREPNAQLFIKNKNQYTHYCKNDVRCISRTLKIKSNKELMENLQAVFLHLYKKSKELEDNST